MTDIFASVSVFTYVNARCEYVHQVVDLIDKFISLHLRYYFPPNFFLQTIKFSNRLLITFIIRMWQNNNIFFELSYINYVSYFKNPPPSCDLTQKNNAFYYIEYTEYTNNFVMDQKK